MRDKKGQDCPSALDLFEYMNSTLPETQTTSIRKHVETCEICIEVLRNLKGHMAQDKDRRTFPDYKVPEHISELGKQWTTKAAEAMKQIRPSELAFGQLWSTKILNRVDQENEVLMSRIVTILSEDSPDNSSSATIIVAPISLELEFQSKYDLRISEKESPLGYAFMVEVWNQTTTLVSQMDSYLGSLSENLKDSLKLLNRVYLGLGDDLSSLSDRIGWPILHDNDPRSLFQMQEAEESKYLREPALKVVHEWELGEAEPMREQDYLIFNSTIDDGSLSWTSLAEKVPIAAASKPRLDSLYIIKNEEQYEVTAKFVLDVAEAKLMLVLQKLSRNLQGKNIKVTIHTKDGLELSSGLAKAREHESITIDPEGKIDQTTIEKVQVLFTKT